MTEKKFKKIAALFSAETLNIFELVYPLGNILSIKSLWL